jgi:hypothetical protein
MASSKRKRSTRKVKSLKPKSVSGKKAKGVKGGLYIKEGKTVPLPQRENWIDIH